MHVILLNSVNSTPVMGPTAMHQRFHSKCCILHFTYHLWYIVLTLFTRHVVDFHHRFPPVVYNPLCTHLSVHTYYHRGSHAELIRESVSCSVFECGPSNTSSLHWFCVCLLMWSTDHAYVLPDIHVAFQVYAYHSYWIHTQDVYQMRLFKWKGLSLLLAQLFQFICPVGHACLFVSASKAAVGVKKLTSPSWRCLGHAFIGLMEKRGL